MQNCSNKHQIKYANGRNLAEILDTIKEEIGELTNSGTMIMRLLAFSNLEIRERKERKKKWGLERRAGFVEASWQLGIHPSGSFNWEDISALPFMLGCPAVEGAILSILDDDSSNKNNCNLTLQ